MNKQYAMDIEWCTLIHEQCKYNDCDYCPCNQPEPSIHEDNLKECEFVKSSLVDNYLPCTVNLSNTMGKTQVSNKLKKFIQEHNLKLTGYSLTNLKQYPMFFTLKKTIGLGVPDKIYANKNEVCVVMYENDVYIIAPRIDHW